MLRTPLDVGPEWRNHNDSIRTREASKLTRGCRRALEKTASNYVVDCSGVSGFRHSVPCADFLIATLYHVR